VQLDGFVQQVDNLVRASAFFLGKDSAEVRQLLQSYTIVIHCQGLPKRFTRSPQAGKKFCSGK
jgi:hypothetical protein